MNWLTNFNPGMFAGAGFGAMPTATANSYDGRTPYTGAFQTGVDARTEAGNQNNVTGTGATLGPEPVYKGGSSQLYGRDNSSNNGYWGTYGNPVTYPSKPSTPPNGGLPQWGGAPHTTPGLAGSTFGPPPTPKPGELPPGRQTMMGQWGGGGWNVGSGAPASMQPMWLGSVNGGQSWAQAPSYNANAPQFGQTTPMWQQAPNQDPDSPTWVQRGR